MIEAVSCGGIVIYRGKILTLYKSYRNKYEAGFCRKEPLSREKPMNRLLSARYMRSPAYTAPSSSTWEKASTASAFRRHRGKRGALVSDGSSGTTASTERRILCGFGLLQVSRSISSAEVSNERQILEKAYEEYQDLRNVICGAATNIFKAVPQGWI